MPHYQHPQHKRHLKPEVKLLQLQVDWTSEYRETAGLLEEKLLNYVRLNRQLRKHLQDRYHLIQLYEGKITINLRLFSHTYTEKFIQPNTNAYAFGFMEQLRPVLQDYLQESRIRQFAFKFIFRFNDLELEKTMELTVES
ncbi:MAG: hypothetical protein EOO20_09210 [Chryseobacterium sp.]|nr:MAG: hypothetical protein EOO20_09210 [Chryseobacterium sp.]